MRIDSFTSYLHRGAAKGEGRQIALHSASAPRELERKAPDCRGPRRSWRSLEVRTSFGAASLRRRLPDLVKLVKLLSKYLE